jgi:taurine dioxygenase
MRSPQIIPSGPACGAEVSGVNLAELDALTIAALQQAVKAQLIVVVRGEALSSKQLLALGEIFGTPEPQGISALAMQDPALRREHLVVSSQMQLQRPTGSLGVGAEIWQSDLSYRARPCSIALLHACEVPAGARVSFANQYQAYETLSAELKARIEGRMLLHDESINSHGQLREGFDPVNDPREATGAQHRIVRTHPDTRRKALYLGRRRNAWIIGMPLEESEALLDQLWAHATQPALLWTHDWQASDTLVWDNRCLLYRHHVVDGTPPLMYRVQLRGELPR